MEMSKFDNVFNERMKSQASSQYNEAVNVNRSRHS
jgi:hypothetical protein